MKSLVLAFGLGGCAAPEPVLVLPPLHLADPVPAPTGDTVTEYARRALALCAAPGLSPLVREALAQDVAAVALATFPTDAAYAEAYVALVCIESGYDQSARSPVGAVGVAQVMPAYAAEFAAECGLPKPAPTDVAVLGPNLRLGACHFRHLLEATSGNIPLALAGYNAGAASKTTSRLRAGVAGAAETSGYLARHYVLTERLRATASEAPDGGTLSH
jgi:soluble lytic murein transglycosylase-like protein